MARRQKAKLSVSLFPFLSILACVIGTLTLMITALALGQMDDDSLDQQLRLDALKKQLAADLKLIEQLKAEIAKYEGHTDDLLQKILEARRELERVLVQQREIKQIREQEPEAEIEFIEVDLDAHKKRIAEMLEELEEVKQKKDELLAELKKRDKPPEEAEVIVQPGGSGQNLKPTFVECTSTGLIIHDGDAPTHVRTADIKSDPTFNKLLERIASSPRSTVIFLVRDDAVGVYYAARAVALEKRARNGKLPIVGHGKLDLSLFTK